MYTGILHTHRLVVTLFLLIYLIKTILLLTNKNETLASFVKKTKVPEMIISFLFLGTGLFLAFNTAVISTFLLIKFGAVAASIPLAIVGFKKENKVLALLSLLLIFGSYGLAEVHKKRALAPVPQETVQAVSGDQELVGKQIFEKQCVLCHGKTGDAGVSGAKNLLESTLSGDEIKSLITNGKGVMPAYGKVLDAKQIEAVAAYAKTFRK